uniref:Uncharacterized protein n=1 Tax=Triticum urartu TaxID=4572 RepID=A0A8R7UUI5_TRIUA
MNPSGKAHEDLAALRVEPASQASYIQDGRRAFALPPHPLFLPCRRHGLAQREWFLLLPSRSVGGECFSLRVWATGQADRC